MGYFEGDDQRFSGNITLFLFFKPNHFKGIFMSNKKKKRKRIGSSYQPLFRLPMMFRQIFISLVIHRLTIFDALYHFQLSPELLKPCTTRRKTFNFVNSSTTKKYVLVETKNIFYRFLMALFCWNLKEYIL